MKEWLASSSATDVIAFYAATIASITLLWNIANAILEKMSRLKVTISIKIKMIGAPGIGIINDPSYVLSIIATNLSPYDLYISKPKIQGKGFLPFPRKIEGHSVFYITKLSGEAAQYPFHLKPREQFETDIEIRGQFLETIKKYKRRDKLRIIITDTAGKKFYSNTIKIEHFLNLESNGLK